MYELLIRGAWIADGTGTPLRRADLAVGQGCIAALGNLSGERADTVIDAADLVLAPGFVDVHTHYDAQLLWDSLATPSPALGVTTVVTGNCGFGIAPCRPGVREVLLRNLSVVEAMPLDALRAGVREDYVSFADYLGLLETLGVVPNVAVFAGHSVIRSNVMGPAASERAASEAEIAEMRQLLADALDAGAIGFASSFSHNHFGEGGIPMPSRLAQRDETDRLIDTLADARHGVFQLASGPDVTVADMESWASVTRRPVIWSALFHMDAFPDRAPRMLAEASAAQARGNRVYAQVTSQPLSMEFTLANAYPLGSLEAWEPLLAADRQLIAQRLQEPSFRAAFREQLAAPKKGKIFYGDWSRVEIAQVANDENRSLEGTKIAEAAAARGCDPQDLFFDLALGEDLRTIFVAQLLNADEEAVEPLLHHDASILALSDAGAHLSFMCDAGYALHLLSRWVRERQSLRLEEAIRQLTTVPAELYGISGRGRLEPGARADLVLFDPDTVGVSRPRRIHDLPGGASRLIREPSGIHGVWINGVRVRDETDYCVGERCPGEVLRRFAA